MQNGTSFPSSSLILAYDYRKVVAMLMEWRKLSLHLPCKQAQIRLHLSYLQNQSYLLQLLSVLSWNNRFVTLEHGVL